ncbi:MAG: helix-turn-helix domain-containing protein [Acidobacteriia bacterium]|nr:helix-turn-helix domain-containing protein [Terriglobia bacterium]
MAQGTFGERLKREREMREVSLDEISAATRISNRYLQALESEEWSKLPGGVFARGFVRSIARYLGLDEDSLLAEFDLARSKEPPPQPYQTLAPTPQEMPRWLPAAVAALVFLLLLVGAVYGWRRLSARRSAHTAAVSVPVNSPSSASAASTPAATAPPVTTPAAAASLAPAEKKPAASAPADSSLDLSVSASAATRVRIVADGVVLLDGEMHSGDTLHFAANERFEVTAADSSAVLLELNGQAMPPIGTPGSSGTISLSRKDLRQTTRGSSYR